MKFDIPIQINGYACILDDEDFCYGEAELDCKDCEHKVANQCSPIMIELIPTEEWVERVAGVNDTHKLYTEALGSLKVDLDHLKKSLMEATKING